MDWFFSLVMPTHGQNITSLQSLIAIFLVISSGIFFGRLKIKNLSLGNAGIMFAGLFFGHLGYTADTAVLDFLKDFGLMLFVYGIGIQVGPYFFSSFQKQGLIFNLFALFIILFGVGITLLIFFFTPLHMDILVGIMSGAVTNTPGLGAAQSTIANFSGNFFDPANAYAIAYPIGVLCIIFVLSISKFVLRVDVSHEIEKYENQKKMEETEKPKVLKCVVKNKHFDGKKISDIVDILGKESINISRIKEKNSDHVMVPTRDTTLHLGDTIVIVGVEKDLKLVLPFLGEKSEDMTIEENGDVMCQTFVVTRRSFAGKPLEMTNIQNLYGVRITRINRGEVEFVAHPRNRLLFGDHVTVVGTGKDLQRFESFVGNNKKYLYESNLPLVFIGLILGVLLGSIPFFIPGLPSTIKLGTAAGPLIVALFISRYSPQFGISTYMNKGSITLIKDLGISLFFATVGLKAGSHFYETFITYHGLIWIFYTICITIIPLFIMMCVGYWVLRINFLQLMGILSASYTDSIALIFITSYLKTDIPNQSYVLTYPFANIIRILMAQLLVILFL